MGKTLSPNLHESLQGDSNVAACIDEARSLGTLQSDDQIAPELRQLIYPVAGIEGIKQCLALRAQMIAKVANDEHLQRDREKEDQRQNHCRPIIRIGHIEEVHRDRALHCGGADKLCHAGNR